MLGIFRPSSSSLASALRGLGLEGGDALFKGLAFLDELLPRLGVDFSLHRGGVVVALLALVLELAQFGEVLIVEADDEIGIGLHEAVGDVLLYRGQIVLDELVIQHDGRMIPGQGSRRQAYGFFGWAFCSSCCLPPFDREFVVIGPYRRYQGKIRWNR